MTNEEKKAQNDGIADRVVHLFADKPRTDGWLRAALLHALAMKDMGACIGPKPE